MVKYINLNIRRKKFISSDTNQQQNQTREINTLLTQENRSQSIQNKNQQSWNLSPRST